MKEKINTTAAKSRAAIKPTKMICYAVIEELHLI